MANWRSVLAHIADDVDNALDELKYRMHYRLGGPDRIKIVPFNSFGKPGRFYIKGRVLEDKGEQTAGDNDTLWRNLVNMYRRMESDEVPHARLKVRYGSLEKEIIADEEGYFEAWLDVPPEPVSAAPWQEVQIELIEPRSPEQPNPVTATARVFLPPATARYGVISDIDDTVLKSDATHVLRMARNVFLGNARTRLPFPGVAAFYRALLGKESNPLFFVSSSPWNLYDLLVDFFHLQDIPLGPILFLRDWGVTEEEILPLRNRAYKLTHIHRLVDFYQELPFILIGDSGQEDPEIYHEIVTSYPKRVMAVYIRNVTTDLERPEAVRALAKKVIEAGSTLILADDTLALAKHAAEQGWIDPTMLAEIADEKEKDEAPPSVIEKLTGETEPAETPTVAVQGETKTETKQAVEGGAIESALETGETKKAEQAPTVVVNPDDPQSPQPEK